MKDGERLNSESDFWRTPTRGSIRCWIEEETRDSFFFVSRYLLKVDYHELPCSPSSPGKQNFHFSKLKVFCRQIIKSLIRLGRSFCLITSLLLILSAPLLWTIIRHRKVENTKRRTLMSCSRLNLSWQRQLLDTKAEVTRSGWCAHLSDIVVSAWEAWRMWDWLALWGAWSRLRLVLWERSLSCLSWQGFWEQWRECRSGDIYSGQAVELVGSW